MKEVLNAIYNFDDFVLGFVQLFQRLFSFGFHFLK